MKMECPDKSGIVGTNAAAAAPGAAVAEFKLPAKPLERWSSQELAALTASSGQTDDKKVSVDMNFQLNSAIPHEMLEARSASIHCIFIC